MFDPPITTTGTIQECPQPKIYHVELPNGKVVIGHIPKSQKALHEILQAGDRVHLELTPFDLSKARIVGLIDNADS